MSSLRQLLRWLPVLALGGVLLSETSMAHGEASRTPFPTAGLLVFTCGGCPHAEFSSRLFTVRPDGRRFRALPNGIGDYEPRWSPDGRALAFSSAFQEIWVSRPDGSHRRRLTHPSSLAAEAADTSPAWFPDGRRLVFVRLLPGAAGGDGRTALWTVAASGRAAKRLLGPPQQANVVSPDVSPDGRRIAFNDVSERLWQARSDGTHPRRLGPPTVTGRNPRWSPDHTSVAFFDNTAGSLLILDLRTNLVRTVATSALDSYSWSPDGAWLAVARSVEYPCDDPTGPCEDLELWIVNASDSRERQIFRSAYGEIYGLDWREPLPGS